MGYHAFRWRAAVMVVVIALPTALMFAIGSEHEGVAQAPDAKATASATSAPSAAPPAPTSSAPHGRKPQGTEAAKSVSPAEDKGADPTITAVMPAGGPANRMMTIALLGTGFIDSKAHPLVVTFGPLGAAGGAPPPDGSPPDAGTSDRCQPVEVVSERLLHCTLPDNLTAGEAQRFIVSVTEADGRKRSSDPSTATYTVNRPVHGEVWSVDANCGSLGCVAARGNLGALAGTKAQIHLTGRNFVLGDGGAPTVEFAPTGADGGRYPCDPVMLVGPEELVCYLSQVAFAQRNPISDLANDEFEVKPRQP
jgi:hypothetical protein